MGPRPDERVATPRWLAAGLVATLLGCGDDPPCEVEALVADALGGPADRDCGTASVSEDDAAFVAAQECALQAVADAAEFQVVWELQGTDSFVRRVYYAKAGGPVFDVFLSQGEGGLHADRHECAALELNTVFTCDSTRLRYDLCLVCTDPSSDTTLCRER